MIEFITETTLTWCFFFGSLIIDSISFTEKSLFNSFIIVWVLIDYVFQRISPFHINYQTAQCCLFLYYVCNVHGISDDLTFLSDNIHLCILSLFFSQLAWIEVYQIYWSVQRSSFCFQWFSMFFFFQSHWLLL